MVPQLSHTWRGSKSPGGTRSASLAPHFEQKFIGGKGMSRLRPPQQLRELVKTLDNVIRRGAEEVDGRGAAVDPERSKAEGLRPARVPAVARDKGYRRFRRAQLFHREPVYGRGRLVDFSRIDADDRADQVAQS